MSTADNCGICQQKHASNKNLFQILIKKQFNKMAPISKQPLNGHGVRKISWYELRNNKKTDNQIGIRLGIRNVGNLCCRGTEMVEELRKMKVDDCGSQEVQWRGYKLVLLELKGEGRSYGGREMMLARMVWKYWSMELCKGVVKIQKRSNKMMTMCLIFEEKMILVICV